MGYQYDAPGPDPRWVLAVVGAAFMLLTGAIAVAAAWKSSVYDAVLPFGVLAVIFGLQLALVSLPAAQVPAEAAWRHRQGGCLPDDSLDPPSRELLRRAQHAIAVITSSEVCRAGLLDRAAAGAALAIQEADIAETLRNQARLGARRAELTPVSPGPITAAVSAGQDQAAQAARSSVAARVLALERYAADVAAADAAYHDRAQAARLAGLQSAHLDMLARTAADEHGIAEIEVLSQQARIVTLALRDQPAWPW